MSVPVSPLRGQQSRHLARVIALAALGGVLFTTLVGLAVWALVHDPGEVAPPAKQGTVATTPRPSRPARTPASPPATATPDPLPPISAAPAPIEGPVADPVPAPAPALPAPVQCPTGSLDASLVDVSLRVDGDATYATPTGVLTNNYTATIAIAEILAPQVEALDSEGRAVQSFGSGGQYDIQVPAGQPRPQFVVLEPGQSIGFRFPEERIYEQPELIVSWVTLARPGWLMPLWHDIDLARSCGTVGGWR